MNLGYLLRDYSKRNSGKDVLVPAKTLEAAASQQDAMRMALENIKDSCQSKGQAKRIALQALRFNPKTDGDL